MSKVRDLQQLMSHAESVISRVRADIEQLATKTDRLESRLCGLDESVRDCMEDVHIRKVAACRAEQGGLLFIYVFYMLLLYFTYKFE